jgi:tRNA A37 threonylcarbamoyladenosine biosynthesis protein TsaE
VDDLALPELLEGPSVTLIEWGDTIRPALPLEHLEVRLALDDVEDARRVELIVVGERWSTRRAALSRLITGAVEAARC